MTDARRWMEHGTQLFLSGVTGLDDAGVAAPSGLPGWGRRHLLAHVAANAEALRNLVHWAETGEETPMYASSDARARGIEEGSQLPAATLLAWPRSSAEKLDAAMASLSDEQWAQLIVTAQGRTVPATEIRGCGHGRCASMPLISVLASPSPIYRPISLWRLVMTSWASAARCLAWRFGSKLPTHQRCGTFPARMHRLASPVRLPTWSPI